MANTPLASLKFPGLPDTYTIPKNDELVNDGVKSALLQLAQKVAYVDEHGQDYYDDLYNALYPAVGVQNIIAVFNSGGVTIYDTNTLDDLRQYLTVTAIMTDSSTEVVTTYTLSGSMDTGTQTITVSYGGKTTTFTVTVVEWLVSITAVFTQGSATIYTTDTLDTLKQYLTVTATYSDSTTAVVTDYTLSGTLGEGTRTITVSYGGKTDTFNVVCTVNGWLYHFNESLVSAGSEDLLFDGTVHYGSGVTGESGDYSYWHDVTTEGTASTAQGSIYKIGITKIPNFSNDFTISCWFKSITAMYGNMFAFNKWYSNNTNAGVVTPTNVKSGWTVVDGNPTLKYRGPRITFSNYAYEPIQGRTLYVDLYFADNTCIQAIHRPPTDFDTTVWHHYAITRKNGVIYFFVDGEIIWTVTNNKVVVTPDQIVCAGGFGTTSATATTISQSGNGSYMDDFFIAEYCKWDEEFNPAEIMY